MSYIIFVSSLILLLSNIVSSHLGSITTVVVLGCV